MRTARSKVTLGSAPTFRCSERAEKRKEVLIYWQVNSDDVYSVKQMVFHVNVFILIYLSSFIWSWRRNIELFKKKKTSMRQGKRYRGLSFVIACHTQSVIFYFFTFGFSFFLSPLLTINLTLIPICLALCPFTWGDMFYVSPPGLPYVHWID